MIKNKTYIIAEIGINHNGSKNKIFKLIYEAKKNGADAVKFQLYEPITLANPLKLKKGNFFSKNKKESLYKMWKRLRIKDTWLGEISQYTKKIKIDLGFSVFDKKSLNKLDKIKYKFIKVASSDITDLDLLKNIAKKKKPVIISTGMANFNEIKKVKSIFKDMRKLFFLHCVSLYPAKINDINLARINKIRKIHSNVGFSDHTIGISSCIEAINMRVKIIEKHFTLDQLDEGPDHFCSADPAELKHLCLYAKHFKLLTSKKNKKQTKRELSIKKFARKSLFAKKLINKNDIFSYNNIYSARPYTYIPANKLNIIINKRSKRKIKKYHPIRFKDF